MKNIFRYILALAAVSLTAVACVKETPFQPGDPEEEGCYGVYFPAQESDLVRDPADAKTATISVMRTNTEGAITVPVTVVDTAGIFTVSELVFEDGQSESSISLEFPDAEVGVTYELSLSIDDWQYASKYSSNPNTLSFSILFEKWNDLGVGTFTDVVVSQVLPNFDAISTDVHIYQNDADKTQYRIPMSGIYSDSCDEYLYLTLMNPGNSVGDVVVTQDGLVWFDPFDTGISVSTDGGVGNMLYYHMGATGAEENLWAYSYVAQYADDGTTPEVIRLAPYVLIGDTGYGADMTQEANAITIVFPGGELVDYSLSVLTGLTTDGVLPVQFTVGADVDEVRYQVYEGTLTAGEVANYTSLIGLGDTEYEVAPVLGSPFGISCSATGLYTLVAVSMDAEGEAQQSASTQVYYLAEGDEKPVKVFAGIEATNKYGGKGWTSDNTMEYYIYGSDLVSVKTYLARYDAFLQNQQAVINSLLSQPDVDAEILEQINGTGTIGVYSDQTPGTEYVFLVYASNGYESTAIYATTKTTGVLDVTLEDMLGTYDVTYTSYFNGSGLTESWVIEASDDETKGNIMLTSISGLSGGNPVYGNFDKESATMSFFDGQYIGNLDDATALYFMNAASYDDVSFDIVGEGRFTGPSEMFGINVNGGNQWYEIYTSVSAVKTGDASASAYGTFSVEGKAVEVGTKIEGTAGYQPEAVLCGPREARKAEFSVEFTPGAAPLERSFDRTSVEGYATLVNE